MTQFNPPGNSTVFPEEVPDTAQSMASTTGGEAESTAYTAEAEMASTAEAEMAPTVEAVSDQEEIFPPCSAPALPAVTRKSRKKTASVPARKRRRTPSPIPSPQRSPIPVLRLFRNAENDEFMRLAKQIRKSRRIQEQNKK